MKKRRFLIPLLALLCLCAALTLIACGHTHTYGEWIETTAPTCTARGIKTRVCDCGHSETQYVDLKAHIYSEWVETLAATCVAEGSHYKTCKICSYKVTEAIPINEENHAFSWKNDATNHWKVCTRTGCTAQVNKGSHTPVWSSDATNHWKDCTACGYNIDPAAAHTYDAENTCVCGDYKDKGVRFTLYGTYKVSDYTGTATEVVIPSIYKGVAVTSIGSYAFQNCSNLTTTITIPDSVTSIGDWAFSWCSQLTMVNFGANSKLTSIGNGAFYDCDGLTTITIPDSVTSIGDRAFYGCSQLTTVEFGANSKLTSIGEKAFYSCDSLTTITIPASVTSIGNEVFSHCSQLTTVTFGANSKLTRIGDYAFTYCSQLTTVYYGGSASDWEKIGIGSDGNYYLTSATRYYYSATEPTEAGNWWYYDQNGKPAVWGE